MKQEKLEVRIDSSSGCLPGVLMTRAQALRYGDRNMPDDLRRAGFSTAIFRSDPEIHGGDWFRINYGKSVRL